MRKRELIKAIETASDNVLAEISGFAKRGGIYAAGLSTEGYAGGYLQALSDVRLLIESDVLPKTRAYWKRP